MHLVAKHIPTLQRKQLARPQTDVSGEQNHRSEGRAELTEAVESAVRQVGKLWLRTGDQVLPPA